MKNQRTGDRDPRPAARDHNRDTTIAERHDKAQLELEQRLRPLKHHDGRH